MFSVARVMVICVSNDLKADFQNLPMIKGGWESVCDRMKLHFKGNTSFLILTITYFCLLHMLYYLNYDRRRTC